MKDAVIKILLSTVLFFFIYNPPLSFLPMNSGIIIGGCFFIYFLLDGLKLLVFLKQIYVNKHLLNILGILGVIILYSLLNVVINGTFDFQVIKSYLSYILFYIPGAFGIIQILKKRYTNI